MTLSVYIWLDRYLIDAQKQKFIQHFEVPVLCICGNDTLVAGYKKELVRCSSVEEGIIAPMSFFHVFHIQFDQKSSAFSVSISEKDLVF